MNDTERILSAINKIDRRIDDIEKRVSAVEEATAAKIERQQASIEALTRKVADLAHSDAAVWKSRSEPAAPREPCWRWCSRSPNGPHVCAR